MPPAVIAMVLPLLYWLLGIPGVLPQPALVWPPLPVKLADTERAAVIETMQLPVPVQAPLQPAKVEPVAGAAVSVTVVPLAYVAAQVDPQLMPEPLTVPLPVPDFVTLRV